MSDPKNSSNNPSPFNPSTFTFKKKPADPPDYVAAALKWYRFGFKVIPISPESKKTAVYWDPWLDDLSEEAIETYWGQHPTHEVGFIVGDDVVVFDADCHDAIAALTALEWNHGISPSLVAKTSRGEHHFFKKMPGTYVKTTGHGSSPDREIDVKTGRTMVALAPSGGKSLLIEEASEMGELVEATQAFIDAVHVHKGQPIPRPPNPVAEPRPRTEPSSDEVAKLSALINCLDAGCGREEWLRVLIVIFNVTGGSDEGFNLADNWSSTGGNYTGRKDVETAWRSFRPDVANPVGMGTLFHLLKAKGIDPQDILDPFEICEGEVIEPSEQVAEVAEVSKEGTILDKFSLTGMSAELEKVAVEQVPILGEVVLQGQATVWYAEPNSGKTLLALKLLADGIEAKKVDPAKVYYLNLDDTSKGLYEKVKIAEDYGFHMLAEGYQGFSAKKFVENLRELIYEDQAQGVVIIADTLKKLVDLMKKDRASDFGTDIRKFVSKGGTFLALAHTTKNRKDGRAVPDGTNDIPADVDCIYVIETVTRDNCSGQKVIAFENRKRRGNVPDEVSYCYSTRRDIGYVGLLLSVHPVNPDQIEPLRQAEQLRSDAELISVAISCITEGTASKMLLAKAISERSGVSRSTALGLIERYTGDNPALHRWQARRGAHGKLAYELLEPAPTDGLSVTRIDNGDLF